MGEFGDLRELIDVWSGEGDIQRVNARTLKRLFAMDPRLERLSQESQVLIARAIDLGRIDLLPPEWRQGLIEGAVEALRVIEVQLR